MDDDARQALILVTKALLAEFAALTILRGSLDTTDQLKQYNDAHEDILTALNNLVDHLGK